MELYNNTSRIPDVIIFTLSRCDNPYSSTSLSIAKEMAKQTRVFYIDNPFTLKELFLGFRNERIKKRSRSMLFRKQAYSRLDNQHEALTTFTLPPVIPMNFLPQGQLYSWVSKFNNWILFMAIKKLMNKFNIHEFIFLNVFNPFYCLDFPAFFKPKLFIYYTMDDIAQSLYVQRHGARLEGKAMQKADFTLATSKELERMASEKSKHTYYLPNGVDHSVFLNGDRCLEKPMEYQAIPVPIIVFIGNCDHRIDYDLLKLILSKHWDKVVALVGPHSVDSDTILELKNFPNLVLIGRKDLSEIPAYLGHAQCLIIPYKCNALTKSIYPLKLNEYLASGVPVVSTPFSKDVRSFEDVILLSESAEDFCDKISLAIKNDDVTKREMRIHVANQNKWENRAHEFWGLVTKHLEN